MRKDGIRLPVLLSITALKNAHQQIIGFLGIAKDISERKRTENALRESQQFLQTVLDIFPLSVFWKDRNSVYLGCNPQFAKTLGLQSCLEIVGKTDFDFSFTEAEILGFRADDRQVMESGTAMLGREETVTLPTGEQRWLETNKVPLRDWKGNAIGILGTYQDITDRKQYQEKILDFSNRLTLALESGAIGTWDWNLLNEVNWDERMYEIYGLLDLGRPAIYQDWFDAIHPDDQKKVETAIEDAIQRKRDYNLEFRIWRTDGVWRWIKAIALIQRDKQGQPLRMTGINYDITEQKQAEQRMRQQAEREALLREITQRIRHSLDLQTIFATATQEIRRFLQVSRVGIFQFDPDSRCNDGEFVAESVAPGFMSVLNIRIHDRCFGEQFAPLYQQGLIQATDDINKASLQDCHREILSQLQIRANLILPLLNQEELWGFLCIHQCLEPRQWQPSETSFTQEIANQLSIAIQQASLYKQMQSELAIRKQTEVAMALQLQQQQILGAIAQQVRQSLNLEEILAKVTQQVKDLINSDRVIIFRLFPNGRSEIVAEAVSNEFVALKYRYWENEKWSQNVLDYYWQGLPRIVPDVMTDTWTNCIMEYSIESKIQSKMVAPILQEIHSSENHRWVAPGENNQLWGILVVHACQEKRVWQESEAQILQQIANQLAIAIQQANLFEQLQLELVERQQAQQQLVERNQQLAISNEELARATRLKDEFLANMSHELRTPLNAILGMTEGLQDEVFGSVNEQQIKALQTIESSGSHLLELINDILDVAKIESGQLELDCIPTAVVLLCQSSVTFIKQLALKKHIQLEIKLPPHLPDLLVDERRIRQVLINLLNNAVKFTPEGGHITLEVSCQKPFRDSDTKTDTLQNYLRIAITDTGIGIAPENMDKLFEPFIQIDSALNRQYAGTGLGLALVKRLVELHGGQVGVTSELGVGSCFTIDLPYITSDFSSAELEIPSEPSIKPYQLEQEVSPLILLAEDNEANVSTISNYLRAKGYRIVVAKNGEQAIACCQSENPDLILMDIQMPGMDGLEAIGQIRSHPNLVNVPIIALTALAMIGDRDRCLAAGANDYITKPVKLKQLVITIQQLLVS
ncbi:GAF domain-containing protein [Aerosakkonemataceae cyanobacterium BLCC-F50]|uniref:histidine kinase n=1 Tax=Floridaenema flaviceps BLCC-F50 TaxID=3153642 RepID=A0ABV4Y087_9CYAN